MRASILHVAVVALLAVGCGGQQLASRYVKSQQVAANEGATILVTSTDDAALEGAQIVIPPGALSQDTTITLEVGQTDVVSLPNKAAGPVAIWGPSGTKFNFPVQMTLPFRLTTGQQTDNMFIQVVEDDGTAPTDIGHSRISVDAINGLVHFNVSGFTSFQPGTAAGTACRSDADCGGGGDVCVNGVCQAADDGGQPDGGFCSSNADCPAGEVCLNGACASSGTDAGPGPDGGVFCGPNGVCPAGEVCDSSGVCQPVCVTDADCPVGEFCANGVCEPGGVDGGPGPDGGTLSCSTTADCPLGEACVNGVCEGMARDAGFPDAGVSDGGSAPDAGVSCNTNADCPAGDVCANGVCESAGQPDAGPDAGSAGSPCRTNLDCDVGLTCTNGICQ